MPWATATASSPEKGSPTAGLCLSSAAPTLRQFQRPVHHRLGQRRRKPGLREVGAGPPLPTATLRQGTGPAPAPPAGPVSGSPVMPPTPLALLPFHRRKRGSPEAALAPGHRAGERDPKTLARRAPLPPEPLAMTGLRVESRGREVRRGPGSRAMCPRGPHAACQIEPRCTCSEGPCPGRKQGPCAPTATERTLPREGLGSWSRPSRPASCNRYLSPLCTQQTDRSV